MLICSKSLLLSCEVKWCQGLACKTAHLSALISAVLKLQKKPWKKKEDFSPSLLDWFALFFSPTPACKGCDSRLNDALYVCRRLAAQTIVPRLFKHRGKGGAIALRANIKMPHLATLTGYFSRRRVAELQLCRWASKYTWTQSVLGNMVGARTVKAIWLQISHSWSVRQDKAN